MGYLCFQYITRKESIPFLPRGPCSHYVVRYHYIDDTHKEEIADPREETNRVPTRPGKPGKMKVHLENLEISWKNDMKPGKT